MRIEIENFLDIQVFFLSPACAEIHVMIAQQYLLFTLDWAGANHIKDENMLFDLKIDNFLVHAICEEFR